MIKTWITEHGYQNFCMNSITQQFLYLAMFGMQTNFIRVIKEAGTSWQRQGLCFGEKVAKKHSQPPVLVCHELRLRNREGSEPLSRCPQDRM